MGALKDALKQEKEKLIDEGLIYTYDAKKTVNLLNRYDFTKKYMLELDITGEDYSPTIVITFRYINLYEISKEHTSKKILDFMENTNKIMNNLGWYMAGFREQYAPRQISKGFNKNKIYKYFSSPDLNTTDLIDNYIDFIMIFESKYDKEIEVPKYLYHAAPFTVRKKIEQYGLIPKAKTKKSYHPDRIYFALKEDDAIMIASLFMQIDSKYCDIYKITTDKVKTIRLFKDPNYPHRGVYTMNNIPSSAIEISSSVKPTPYTMAYYVSENMNQILKRNVGKNFWPETHRDWSTIEQVLIDADFTEDQIEEFWEIFEEINN